MKRLGTGILWNVVLVQGTPFDIFANYSTMQPRGPYHSELRVSWRKDTHDVRYLGEFHSTSQCQNACEQVAACNSFTYFTSTYEGNNNRTGIDNRFRNGCYGVVVDKAQNGDPAWAPWALCVSDSEYVCGANSGKRASACTGDEGCQLNGVCNVATGVCNCDGGWGGSSCSTLKLAPANPAAGYNTPLQKKGTSSWGGSIVFDEVSGRWQMFAAEMSNGCGIGVWEANSRIVRASSATPGGAYEFEEVVVDVFAHEPVLARDSNGDWLLYHIGRGDTDVNTTSCPASLCTEGYSPSSGCGGVPGFNPPMSIRHSKTLQGPWHKLPTAVGPGDGNPAPYVFR